MQNNEKKYSYILFSFSFDAVGFKSLADVVLTSIVRYIAKTLYGEEDEDITSEDTKRNVEPPKLLGVHPSSNEKVSTSKPFIYQLIDFTSCLLPIS